MTVYVYRNLRTKRWVIADKPKASAEWPNVDSLVLRNVTFKISEASRLWSISHRLPSGKPYRQVHAYAVGEVHDGALPHGVGIAISYNPDRCGAFTRRDNNAPVDRCEFVHFTAAGAVAIGTVSG